MAWSRGVNTWIVLLLLCLGLNAQESKKGYITFGALIDESLDAEEKMAFEFAVDSVNRNLLMMLTKLELRTKNIYDIHSTSKKVCNLVREASEEDPNVHGVAAIFGPYDAMSSKYVQSFAAHLNIPHIKINPDFDPIPEADLLRMNSKSLNFFPEVGKLADALNDMAIRMKWERIVIITKDSAGMALMKRVMQPVKTSQHFSSSQREVKVIQVKTTLEAALRKLKEMNMFKNVIVDIPLEDVVEFVETGYRLNLMSGYYHYHFTTMDLPAVAEKINHFTTGAVNVTGFTIIPQVPNSELRDMETNWRYTRERSHGNFNVMKKTRNALIYDSVRFVARALNAQMKRSSEFGTEQLNCKANDNWTFGERFYNDLKGTQVLGATGTISFDKFGKRDNFRLELIEFDVKGNVGAVGHWTPSTGIIITKSFDKVRQDISQDITIKHFRIAIKLEAPFVNRREVDDANIPIPEDRSDERYHGFSIDMMEMIAERLNMKNYSYVEVHTGSKMVNGSFTGIIGGLQRREFDIGLSPITVTPERAQYVGFSEPYRTLGISILMKKPAEKKTNLFAFTEPFSSQLWSCIVAMIIGTSVMLFVVGRFSPGQWDNPHPCNSEVDILKNDLTLANCIWFSLGSFFQQGTEIAPKSGGTRIIAAFWWLFCLICISSYTANLAAFLTNDKMQRQIKNANDLSRQEKVKFGCYGEGSTRSFFEKSNISTYVRMNRFMEQNPEYLMKSTDVAVKKVLEGNYAYLMESLPLRYELTMNCDLMEVGAELSEGYYALAFPLNSPYINDISKAILALKDDQRILQTYNKWWKVESNNCKVKKVSALEASKLGLDKFHGVYLIMIALLVIGFIVCLVELFISSAQYSNRHKVSFKKALRFELGYAVRCCSENEKPEIWHQRSKPELPEIEDSIGGSLGKLSLSIGSLNTTILSSRANTTRRDLSHDPSQILEEGDNSDSSCDSLDITRDTTTTTGSQRSLITVLNNHHRPPTIASLDEN